MTHSNWLTANLIEALGWTLLHSLWQATLLAGLLWLASRALSNARLRYGLAYGTLLAQLVLSICTFSAFYEPTAPIALAATTEPIYLVFSSGDLSNSTWQPAALLFWLVVFWGVGLLIGTVRLGLSFGRVRRMRRTVSASVPSAFQQQVEALAQRLGYQGKLRIGVSELVDGPALIGHLKPLLLFPVAVVNQLNLEEAEAVILHELAHLQRQDHWWNLLQCLIEVLFYYHPVIWWIGARIREEREHCCDDVVLQHGPGRLAYAKALLYFEENRTTPATAVALTNTPGGLLGRVQRFLHQQNLPYQMKSRLFLLPLLALIALVATAAYGPVTTTANAEGLPISAVPAPNTLPPAPAAAPTTSDQTASLTAAPKMIAIQPDTLPKGRHQVSSYRNGKSTEVVVEDQEIKELKIDGEVIPPAEFDQHEAMVERLLGVNRGYPRRFQSGQNEFRTPDRQLEDLELHFDRSGQRWERKLEGLGEGWEDFGLRMGELGERIGQSFGDLFQFDSDGNTFHFEFNGDDTGNFLFDLDSLQRTFPDEFRGLEISPDGRTRRFFFDRDDDREYELEEILREKESSLQDEEERLQEMETMIEKLERKKARMKRELEERRRQQEGQDKVRKLRNGGDQQEPRQKNEARNGQIREEARERELALNEQQEEIRRENRERLIEIRRHNEERMAEIQAAREIAQVQKDEGVNYQSIVEKLQDEGLLPKGKFRKLVLTPNSLKVNGQKASATAHTRFLEVIADRYGANTTGENFKITVSHSEF